LATNVIIGNRKHISFGIGWRNTEYPTFGNAEPKQVTQL
jgi:hypothetical protein